MYSRQLGNSVSNETKSIVLYSCVNTLAKLDSKFIALLPPLQQRFLMLNSNRTFHILLIAIITDYLQLVLLTVVY